MPLPTYLYVERWAELRVKNLQILKLEFVALLALICLGSQAALAQEAAEFLAEPEASDLPVKYIGNLESHKFHRPSCPFARIMSVSKRVKFHYRSQAVACGHLPCRYCLPAVWKKVKAVILTTTP